LPDSTLWMLTLKIMKYLSLIVTGSPSYYLRGHGGDLVYVQTSTTEVHSDNCARCRLHLKPAPYF
jgi:hypothetical protein